VVPEDLHVLPTVGRLVWDNLYWRKEQLTVEFSTLDARPRKTAPIDHPIAAMFHAAATHSVLNEPEDIRRIRTGEVESAGSFNQYFSVWDAAHGLIRDY